MKAWVFASTFFIGTTVLQGLHSLEVLLLQQDSKKRKCLGFSIFKEVQEIAQWKYNGQ